MTRTTTILRPPLPLMFAVGLGVGGALLTMVAWRGAKAKTLYLAQCDAALANPRFSNPDLGQLDLEAKTFDGSAEEFERYEWYVARLVSTLDECLSLAPVPQWYATTKTQLSQHKTYLESGYCRKQDYLSHHSWRMRMLIARQTETA